MEHNNCEKNSLGTKKKKKRKGKISQNDNAIFE